MKIRNSAVYRALLAALMISALPVGAALAQLSVNVSVNLAPPLLPLYEQPPIPEEGYLWAPGYWAWGDDGYFWVPGTWVLAPTVGYLWTPGYWGAADGGFLWYPGYWGPHVGFYGGVNYGYGYGGSGYQGGYWQGGHLYYNRAVSNVSNTQITNVYTKTVVNNVTVNQVSYNGGSGGIRAAPSAAELAAAHEPHSAATPAQQQHVLAAQGNHALLASVNHGRPPIAATARPGALTGPGVVAAGRTERPPAAAQKSTRTAPVVARADRAPSAPQHAPMAERAPIAEHAPAAPPPRAPEERAAPQRQQAPPPKARPEEHREGGERN